MGQGGCLLFSIDRSFELIRAGDRGWNVLTFSRIRLLGENVLERETELVGLETREQGYLETFQNCFYDVANRAPCRIQIHRRVKSTGCASMQVFKNRL